MSLLITATGPTSLRTYVFPDANATILTSNAAVTAGQGGTGITSYAVGDLLYASGAAALSKLADVATGSVLVSGGVTTAPAWSASPTLTSVIASNYIRIGAADSSAPGANGDLIVNRGGNPGSGVIYFGGSAAAHFLYYNGTTFNFTDTVLPSGDGTLALGSASFRWQSAFVSASLVNSGYYEGTEMTAPSAGAVNTGRMYFEDNGSGKTRLMVIFNTGVAQQIAIQP